MEQEASARYIISTMAECEDLREIEGEEEEETRGSKEHNGGAGFFRLCHLGSNICTWDG